MTPLIFVRIIMQELVKKENIKPDLVTIAQKVEELTLKLSALSKLVVMSRKKDSSHYNKDLKLILNRDNIPVNTVFVGKSSKQKKTFFLFVNRKGEYLVGHKKFGSPSAAAEYVSGVRRSGWTFWKDSKGRTLKELYKK